MPLISAFSLIDAILFSIVAMIMVFLVLLLLTFIIAQLKRLNHPGDLPEKTKPNSPIKTVPQGSEQNRMVAILVASCIAKEEFSGDVRVVSCKKID